MSKRPDFDEQLIEAAAPDKERLAQYRRELDRVLRHELTRGRRWRDAAVWLVAGVASAWFCIHVFVAGEDAPWYPELPPLVFGVLAIFFLGNAAIGLRFVLVGHVDLRRDLTVLTTWRLGCVALAVSISMIWWLMYPGIKNGALYAVVATFFFLVFAVEAIFQRIKHSELNIQERLLRLEYRLAQHRDRAPTDSADRNSG